MKHYLLLLALFSSANVWGEDQTLSAKLHLCRMSDGVSLDLPCVGKNLEATRAKIDEILMAVANKDETKDVAPKLPKLAATGIEYAKQVCSADIEIVHGQYEACLVDRYVEVIRDISCVSFFPIRNDEYAETLKWYCRAARTAAP